MGNQKSIAESSSHEEEMKSCPVSKKQGDSCPYNVYGEKIDPNNNMPIQPSQEPQPYQNIELSKERKQSGIKKGGTDGTWAYPSEQMFYNALLRKNKARNIQEYDMEYVIRIHNGTNERAWKNVLEWEKYQTYCSEPSLLKFYGNPQAKSIRGMFYKYILRRDHFDRHDWIIDRCGKQIRYILDFYYYNDENIKLEKDNEFYNTKSNIFIDVRPAMFDNFSNFKEYFMGLFKSRINH